MNRAFLPFSKSFCGAILTLVVSTSVVFAAEEVKPAKPDLAKGEALYTNGDAARGIVSCASCHGAAGNSTITLNPKLSAQHDAYLQKQLMDFTTPNRMNPIMTSFAKAMTPEDMKNVSAFFVLAKAESRRSKK